MVRNVNVHFTQPVHYTPLSPTTAAVQRIHSNTALMEVRGAVGTSLKLAKARSQRRASDATIRKSTAGNGSSDSDDNPMVDHSVSRADTDELLPCGQTLMAMLNSGGDESAEELFNAVSVPHNAPDAGSCDVDDDAPQCSLVSSSEFVFVIENAGITIPPTPKTKPGINWLTLACRINFLPRMPKESFMTH